MVWIWSFELQRLGFQKKSRRYWQCKNRYGLEPDDYLSAFLWTEQKGNAGRPSLYELTEFHVTFQRAGHRLHFYYHETREWQWTAGGYTSARELRRLRCDPCALRDAADKIAEAFIAAAGGVLAPRRRRGRRR